MRAAIFVLALLLVSSSALASIRTEVPVRTESSSVVASMVIIDFVQYVGPRAVTIDKQPVLASFDGSYSKIVRLKYGANFVRFVVVDGSKRYQKTKKVVRVKKSSRLAGAAPISHRISEIDIIKNRFVPSEDPMDTRLKWSLSGKPPIPAGLPFLKANKDWDFNLKFTKRF